MLKSRWWWDLSTRDFAALDMSRIVAVLPVAAVEQHGPHLPLGTDVMIGEAYLARVQALTPAEGDADHIRVVMDLNPQVPDRNTRPGEAEVVLGQMAEGLAAAGAEVIAMPCNTAHAQAGAIRAACAVRGLRERWPAPGRGSGASRTRERPRGPGDPRCRARARRARRRRGRCPRASPPPGSP